MKQARIWNGMDDKISDVQKEKINGCILKARIADNDGKYAVERTVYKDNEGTRCVQIHLGIFATLDYYRNLGKKVEVY